MSLFLPGPAAGTSRPCRWNSMSAACGRPSRA